MSFAWFREAEGFMEEYQTVRCLFCETGKEDSVVEHVHKNGWGHAIFARRSGTVRKNGKWVEMLRPLLPSYVFVYFGWERARNVELTAMPHVIRVLHYGDGQGNLTGRDLEFADWIWRQKGRIGVMKALQIGDWIEITDGVFKELRGTIIKMDRRRKTFLVSLDGAGVVRRLWLTYEVVEKREAPR